MPSLNKFEKNIEKINEIFNQKIANTPYSKELRIIFNVGLQSEDLALFPNIRSASSCSDYIEKWYRLGSQKCNGKILPAYKWDILNNIINSHVITDIKPTCNMTEDDYQNFLKQIIQANSEIISEE